MADRRVKLIYPNEMVDEPVLYQMIQRFGLVTNVRQADINPTGGWLIVDLRGDDSVIQQALDWTRQIGITVQEIGR